MNGSNVDRAVRPIFIGSSILASGSVSTDALVKGQIGVFKSDYLRAAANITQSQTPWLIIAQGTGDPVLGSKKSHPIAVRNLISYRGGRGSAVVVPQIIHIGWTGVAGDTVNTLSFDCDKTYTLAFDLLAHFTQAYNPLGVRKSLVHKTPCCDPCASGDCGTADPEVQAQAIVDKINADELLKEWVLADVVTQGTGDTLQVGIEVTGKIPEAPDNAALPELFPFRQDAVRFAVYLDNQQSVFNLGEAGDCSSWIVTTTQLPAYSKATGREVRELELAYRSYQLGKFKYRHMSAKYNQGTDFDLVTDITKVYDLYFLTYMPMTSHAWQSADPQQQELIIAIETGQGDVLESTLNSYFGSVYKPTLDTVDLIP